jgi:hypothetical protein
MNHFRSLATGMTLTFALICPAQQTPARPPDSGKQQQEQSAVDGHLRGLSEKLDLNAAQQAEIRPILQQMLTGREKLMQNSTLSDEERREKQKALHDKADKQVRKFLNEEQKRKLDHLEQEQHP